MSDQIIQANEEMVGAGHATKADTLNRALLVEHNADGTHNAASLVTALGMTAYIQTLIDDSSAADARTTLDVYSKAEVDALVLPTGSFLLYAGVLPSGFLECDGSAISRTTYASLFSVIGIIYGSGDGSTTFNLPDYRGRFLRSWAHGQSTDPDRASRTDRGDGIGGDNVGTKQADEFESHRHGISGGGVPSGSGASYYTPDSGTSVYSSYAGGNETRPINVNVLVCIKY